MGSKRIIEVDALVETCPSNPSQWSGLASDGDGVYIRYRWGTLTVEKGALLCESEWETVYAQRIGDKYAGSLTFYELVEITQGLLDFDFTHYRSYSGFTESRGGSNEA